MHRITVKYSGSCRKCATVFPVGITAIHEKHVGLFCESCAPTDTEEIRKYRQEAANRRADKYEEWAEKREFQSSTILNHNRKHYTSDLAFTTQPGHIPIRSRIIAQNDKAYESLNIANGFRKKSESLRHVRVAGDAERARQRKRDALDAILLKGSLVFDAVFGQGTIVSIHKKSYRIHYLSGGTCAREKSFVVPVDREAKAKFDDLEFCLEHKILIK